MGSDAPDADRGRLAFAAMRAYRRVTPPSLSKESVRHLWETQERERQAWRAVIDVVIDVVVGQTEEK